MRCHLVALKRSFLCPQHGLAWQNVWLPIPIGAMNRDENESEPKSLPPHQPTEEFNMTLSVLE